MNSKRVGNVMLWGGLVLSAAAVPAKVRAQELQVKYVGGTSMAERQVAGRLKIGSQTAMEFTSAHSISIPYERVMSYESRSKDKVHTGLLTEGLWRLVFPWPEAKQLTIAYTDANEAKQVVVLEMSKDDEALLVDVLKARVPRMPRPLPPLVTSPTGTTNVVQVH